MKEDGSPEVVNFIYQNCFFFSPKATFKWGKNLGIHPQCSDNNNLFRPFFQYSPSLSSLRPQSMCGEFFQKTFPDDQEKFRTQILVS